MDHDLTPHLSDRAAQIMKLFKQHGHDTSKMLAANPQITLQDVDDVTMELIGAIGLFEGKPEPAKRRRHRARKSGGAYQLKITLRGSKPPIWRRVLVPGALTLAQLHDVVQTAMGWCDGHLHGFEIDGEAYAPTEMDGYELENGELDESKYRLCDVVPDEKAKFRYEYDFGDGWEHTIVVEKIVNDVGKAGPIRCLTGKGRCPPEDCGGIWGYYQLLSVLADPKHEDYESMIEWTGGPIDPADFDAEQVNEALARSGV
jgi:hypothetical protein